MDIKRMDEAVRFASVAHGNQTRKGDGSPYITHPYTAALYLMSILTQDDRFSDIDKENMVVAVILHDVWEDTSYSLADIENRFGSEVLRLVKGASEHDKSLSWYERKTHTIEYLEKAPMDEKYVSCADKIHNLVSMKRVYAEVGDELWKNFKQGKDAQHWYYLSVAKALVSGLDEVPPFITTYIQLVDEFFNE